MFAKTIIDSDAFIDMPLSTQALYFHLSMRADDEGFINNPKKIQRVIGASDDDLKILIGKKFIIPFESGIVVIKHWRIHNYIRRDRLQETKYQEERALLEVKKNGSYTFASDICQSDVSQLTDTCQSDVSIDKYRLDKSRLDKDSIGEYMPDETSDTPAPKEAKHKHGAYMHVLLKDSELKSLQSDYGEQMTNDCITFLDEYIEMKGYKAKSHYLCIRKWVVDAVKERQRKTQPAKQSNNKFNNFEHREYDFDAIERQLLGNV